MKSVYSNMISNFKNTNYKNSNLSTNEFEQNSFHSNMNYKDVNYSKNLETSLNNFSRSRDNENSNKSKTLFIKRKMKDLIEIRRNKLKEIYDNEKINFKYEIISKDKSIKQKELKENTFEKLNKEELYKPERFSSNMNDNSKQISKINTNSEDVSFSNFKFHPNGNHNQIKNLDSFSKLEKENNNLENPSYSHNNPGKKSFQNSVITTPNQNRISHVDNEIKLHYKTLENLKLEDFFSRKNLQDHLLDKISKQMEKLRFGINDKSYQEKLAKDWLQAKHKNFNSQNEYNNLVNRYNLNYNS